jgi:pyruvate dehydrogenase E2 component (dihydrolipoamide acetyltransferase)
MALIAAPGETVADVEAALAELGGTAAPATVDDPDAAGGAGRPDRRRPMSPARPDPPADATPPTEVGGPPDPPADRTPPSRANQPPQAPVEPSPTQGAVPRRRPRRRRARRRTGRRRGSCPARWLRRLVREHGLRLEDLTGTGPGGRIVRDDVRRAVAARELANASSPARPEGRPHHPQRTAGWEDVPHTRMRRAIAGRLAESNREAPHFAIRGTARVDDLLALRAQLNTATASASRSTTSSSPRSPAATRGCRR